MEHASARQVGLGIMLQVTGGLLLAGLVASGNIFVNCLIRPFIPQTNFGQVVPNNYLALLAYLAYFGFVINVFRQVHGMAIVSVDKRYIEEVDKFLSYEDRMFSLICLFSIVVVPALLISAMSQDENSFTVKFFDIVRGVSGKRDLSCWPVYVFVAYALNLILYFLWDWFTYVKNCKALALNLDLLKRAFGLHFSAKSYNEYNQNWRALCCYQVVLVLIVLMFRNGLYIKDGSVLIPALIGDGSVLPILVFCCFSYTVADYYLNRDFYFGNCDGSTGCHATAAAGKEVLTVKWKPLLSLIFLLLLVSIVPFGLYKAALANQPVSKITLQLKWLYNAGFAGDFVAKESNYWKDMDVEVVQGGTAIDPIKAVLSGKAQFGVATGDQLLNAWKSGAPVVAIALIYKINPLCWIVKDNSKIYSPSDFRGKVVALTYIDDEQIFKQMLKNSRVKVNDVKLFPVKFDLSPFYRGVVDAYPVFRNTQGVEIKKKLHEEKIETHYITPEHVNVVSYSNLYFTTKELIKENPDLVQRFVNGIVRGWDSVRNEPHRYTNIVANYDKTTQTDIITSSLVETANLLPSKNEPFGVMSLDEWISTCTVLFSEGICDSNKLGEIFNNHFVEQANKELKK